MTIIDKPGDDDSNLVKHAKEELTRAGLLGADSDYDGEIGKAVLDIVRLVAAQGHSGGSMSYVIGILPLLLEFQPLSPITNDPSEWVHVGDDLWQNRRKSDAFSTDGGITHYTLDNKTPIITYSPN